MAKKELIRKDINLTDGGINLILKMMQETGLNVQGSLVKLQKRLEAFRKANPSRVDDLNKYIDKAFPDGIEGTQKSLTESKIYEQFLYDNGFLKDADPDKTQLEDEVKGKNRRSREGKKLLDIKDRGGVPAIIGRNADGSPLEDKKRTRPYKLVISDKGIEEAKKVSLPVYVQTKITPQIEMQDRQRKAVARRETRVPPTIDTPLADVAAKEEVPPRKTLQNLIETPEAPPEEPAKPKSKRTVGLMDIIKKGGRKGALMFFPVAGAAATVVDEVLAAKPLNPYRTPEEQEYDRVMEEAKREELIPKESELKGRTMEEVKSRTSFMNQ